jgi:hypothetical protein
MRTNRPTYEYSNPARERQKIFIQKIITHYSPSDGSHAIVIGADLSILTNCVRKASLGGHVPVDNSPCGAVWGDRSASPIVNAFLTPPVVTNW